MMVLQMALKCATHWQKQIEDVLLFIRVIKGFGLLAILGRKLATGNYIMFVDSDDYLMLML